MAEKKKKKKFKSNNNRTKHKKLPEHFTLISSKEFFTAE